MFSAPVLPEPNDEPLPPQPRPQRIGSTKHHGLTDLDLESVTSDKEGGCHLIRKLSTYKVSWIITTLLVTFFCYAWLRPTPCVSSEVCRSIHEAGSDLKFYSSLISAGLSAVLLHELAAVILTHRTAQKAIHLIPNIKESLLPSCLLCLTFAVLVIENMAFVIWSKPWYIHAANVGIEDLDGEPVYTVFYAEWLINVPILIFLAGQVSLGRPATEVAEPLLITNVYIVLAWAAHFMPSPPLRYSFVSASFLMYFRGSYVMCYWVVNWRKRHPEGHILGRPLLAFVLILVFGIYGLVYVGRLHGIVPCRAERIFYQTMNFTTKLFASMTLAGIRSTEFQEVLPTMLANTQTSFKRAINCDDQTPLLD